MIGSLFRAIEKAENTLQRLLHTEHGLSTVRGVVFADSQLATSASNLNSEQ